MSKTLSIHYTFQKPLSSEDADTCTFEVNFELTIFYK